jgi:hypothetical protein
LYITKKLGKWQKKLSAQLTFTGKNVMTF